MKKIKRLLSYLLTAMVIVTAITSTGVIAHASMLPLEEIKAYLILNEKTDEELASLKLDQVLGMLIDSNGNPITIPSDATTVWRYVKSNEDGLEEYQQYNIGKNETIDLSVESGIKTYTIELIIGSSYQLDYDNIRYIIKVYVTNTIQEEIGYELYLQDTNGIRSKVTPERVTSAVNNQLFEITANEWSVPEPENGSQYYLNLSSVANEHPNIRTEVYDFWDYTLNGTGANPITSKVLDQNMMQSGNGLPIVYGSENATMLALVYFDKDNQIIGRSFVSFAAVKDITYIKANLYQKMNDEFTDIVMLDTDHIGFEDIDSVFAGTEVHELCLMLKDGYSAESDIYCVLDAHGATYGDDANSYVSKAVVGHYDTLDDAAACEDIKEQLIPADKTAASRGYKSDYNYMNGGTPFTIFFEDGSAFKILVLAMEYEPEYDESYVRTFTEDPIIGEADPWFRITGATDGNGKKYDTYVVENGKNINMDTYYGYGYQTVFINDANADLSELKPTFWYANTDRVYAVSKETGEKIDENHIRDFSEENQQYTGVIIDNNKENERNYWVTFKKLNNNGSELYVYGPREREVILDDYFEYKHDILIANIGNQPLEDISVELVDSENVKLDSYWTVGGDGNDTLAPFSTTSTDKEYGELPNMAKIRLLPDGDGEVKGTLIISAKDQDPVIITLNGTAQTPEIVTENLSDAVKYVPYQYIIATNNIHDWVETEFSVVDGELPEGITLNKDTGELYGVPKVPTEDKDVIYNFTIEAKYSVEGEVGYFDSAYKEFELKVKPNTNDNVYNASDEGYTIKEHLGTETENSHEFVLENIEEDQLFVSNGNYGEFVDLWLNGEKLYYDENDLDNSDYTKEEGSTRITIKSQTFENKANQNGTNTIAMEFRNNNNEVNRTAQNFNIKNKSDITDKDKVVENVISLINAIPSSVSLSDRETVQKARNAYDALSVTQKGAVTNYNKLIAAENTINNETAALAITNLISDIPTTITLDCKNEVTAARNAYDNLSSEQKLYVTNYNKLLAAEDAIETLEAEEQERAKNKTAAQPVIELIDAIPSTITLESEKAITSARNAYNLLLSNQKGYVTNYQKLVDAEDKLAVLKRDTDTKTVNMVCSVVDKNGEALINYVVEIHSDVQQSRTDENGFARFSNVEISNHTMLINKDDGTQLAKKSFKITEGDSLSLNDDEIITQAGSTFTLAIKVDGENISFMNVESGDKAPELENADNKVHSIDISDSVNDGTGSNSDPTHKNALSASIQTGDQNIMHVWYTLLLSSWATLFVMFVHYRRKRNT